LLVLLTGVSATAVLRLAERLLHGSERPWTGWITVLVCRLALVCIGLKVRTHGAPMREKGVIVANHSSWLDIFVLNAGTPLYFVSKEEVAAWPGIGWLARLTGTVFVRREAREAGRQKTVFETRIAEGHRLLFFPEGTSTDGQRVLPFKTTLFAALYSDRFAGEIRVQPVTVAYQAPKGQEARFYGWWGDMDFGSHLVQMLGAARHGQVDVTWHAPIQVSSVPDRKALARSVEASVRSAHPKGGDQ
jgi:1-acyl-sn-glycerol-3-phosphate acyltransferase